MRLLSLEVFVKIQKFGKIPQNRCLKLATQLVYSASESIFKGGNILALNYGVPVRMVAALCLLCTFRASSEINAMHYRNCTDSVGPLFEKIRRPNKQWPKHLKTICVIRSAIAHIQLMCHCHCTVINIQEISAILKVDVETCKSNISQRQLLLWWKMLEKKARTGCVLSTSHQRLELQTFSPLIQTFALNCSSRSCELHPNF